MDYAIDGIIWRANPESLGLSKVDGSVEDILGFSAEEMVAQPGFWQSRLHPEDADWVVETCLAARRDRRSHRLTYRMITADGRTVWLQDSVKISEVEGQPMVSGVMIDVSELMGQRQELATLNAQNDRFRALYDLVPVAIWEEDWTKVLETLRHLRDQGIDDISGHADRNSDFVARTLDQLKVISVNRAAVEMFRADSAEDLLRRCRDVFLEDRPHTVVLTMLDCILHGKREIEGVNILRRLNGEIVHVMYRISLPDIEDRAGRVVICEMDVTAEHISQERFELVSRASSDVIWDFDIVNDTLWSSDGLKRTFGLDPDEMFQGLANWTSRIHPEDIEAVLENYDAMLLKGRKEWNQVYRFQRGDGSFAVVRDKGYVLTDGAGRAVRMVGSLIDITDQQRLEEQLRQSQKLEAVGQLTGGVAHDFNNLLTVILGNAELIEDRLDDRPDLQKLATMTVTAAERGAELTNRLLAFARKQALEPQVVDLGGLLRGMEGLLRRTLPENIDIRIAVPDPCWKTRLDAGALESALLNLALNARDAMPGGGTLDIEISNVTINPEESDANGTAFHGDHVLVSVSDTGSGIPAAFLDRIFEPFFTTKDIGKGSGLGLSMVYGFVKQSGGEIRAVSEPGNGTSLQLWFPRAQALDAKDEENEGVPAIVGGKEKILVVEDDAQVRANLVDQLEGLGYHVLEASAAPDALAILRATPTVDLLFTDIVMPGGMDGLQLAENARVLRPNLKVLFTSGYSEHAGVHFGTIDSIDELLAKPYRRLDVATMVRRILDRI